MIDIHSHILPNFDDGAKDAGVSLEMLKESFRQGVDTVVSTSHCYPKEQKGIDAFIKKRADRFSELEKIMAQSDTPLPGIVPGCELHLMSDISEYDGLEKLCIGDTKYILLEMPYTPWNEGVFDIIYKTELRGFVPVIAHIDRFLYQDKALLNSLFEFDVLYQVNADTIIDKRQRRNVDMLFETGKIHFIGSDMHNMTKRPPCLEAAKAAVIKHYGEKHWQYLEENNEILLKGGEIDINRYKNLKKKSFFTNIFNRYS